MKKNEYPYEKRSDVTGEHSVRLLFYLLVTAALYVILVTLVPSIPADLFILYWLVKIAKIVMVIFLAIGGLVWFFMEFFYLIDCSAEKDDNESSR